MLPENLHMTYEDAFCALRAERDHWMQRSVEQHAYIQQLEKQVTILQKQLGIKVQDKELFCQITQEAYDRGQAVALEDDLRSACSSAARLVKVIRTNEALGYLNTQYLSSTELYNLLNEHFHVTFKLRAFQDQRSK